MDAFVLEGNLQLFRLGCLLDAFGEYSQCHPCLHGKLGSQVLTAGENIY
jgi:hypothetical protein